MQPFLGPKALALRLINELRFPLMIGAQVIMAETLYRVGAQVIMAETLSHGIRPWSSLERPRRAMAIRYKAGTAYEEHIAAWQAKEERGDDALPGWMLRPERLHSGMSFGTRWDPAVLRAANAATLAIIGGRPPARL